MAHDEQLAWEERAGKPAALAAFAAALLSFTAGIYLQIALADREDGADGLLAAADKEPSDFIVAGVLQVTGVLLLIPVLLYLYRATRYRRKELNPGAAYLMVLGAITLAIVTMARQFQLIDIAKDFFPFDVPDNASELRGDEYAEAVNPEKAAEEEIRDALSPALQGVGVGGSIALAFGVIMISMNAMRAGLLSRFMGILGVIIGVLYVIPIGVQILQLFWLGGLGLLFMGRWPGGRGPAWQTGEAMVWPGAAQQREEIARRREEREREESGDPEPEPQAPKPASRKRRKKRR